MRSSMGIQSIGIIKTPKGTKKQISSLISVPLFIFGMGRHLG
ncbi:hypothetical protein JCM19240_4699 [Vibrio maritimus]|uniref:Uncharacterized protein n=1 Tax=Vibrio maritimus TaxID=990268 RepID=A0A090TBI6_9VIBR|nr:hypothetical protein JCM19240_4699 [Vibrio maritimus]